MCANEPADPLARAHHAAGRHPKRVCCAPPAPAFRTEEGETTFLQRFARPPQPASPMRLRRSRKCTHRRVGIKTGNRRETRGWHWHWRPRSLCGGWAPADYDETLGRDARNAVHAAYSRTQNWEQAPKGRQQYFIAAGESRPLEHVLKGPQSIDLRISKALEQHKTLVLHQGCPLHALHRGDKALQMNKDPIQSMSRTRANVTPDSDDT